MARKETNIYKRKDGRWEARYVKEIGWSEKVWIGLRRNLYRGSTETFGDYAKSPTVWSFVKFLCSVKYHVGVATIYSE